MQPSLDVREVADRMLATAKEFFQEEGFLAPAGFVLEATGNLTFVKLDLHNGQARKNSMRALRQVAREVNAIAVFTIRGGVYRCFLRSERQLLPPAQEDKLPRGWKADGNPHDCIHMEIIVPGQIPTLVTVPYWKDKAGNIEFGAQDEDPLEFVGPAPPSCEQEEGIKNWPITFGFSKTSCTLVF